MIVLMPWQKSCHSCVDTYLEPEICANPNIDPRKEGNPWSCPKCGEMYVSREMSYYEHLQMMQKYYLNSSDEKSKAI